MEDFGCSCWWPSGPSRIRKEDLMLAYDVAAMGRSRMAQLFVPSEVEDVRETITGVL